MADSKKLTLRATYPKGLRKMAKERGHGVCTISVEFPNGERMEEQGTVDMKQAEFAKWAMAMLFCEQLQLPELEPLIRKLMS